MRSFARSDIELRDAVLTELGGDARLAPAEVGVEVRSGVVTLSGIVSSWAKRIAAREAAHRVLGVLDVANELVVHTSSTPGKTDAAIATELRRALEWEPTVPDARVHTTVAGGFVTLEGAVETNAQREHAQRAASAIVGVTAVANRLAVTGQPVSPGASSPPAGSTARPSLRPFHPWPEL